MTRTPRRETAAGAVALALLVAVVWYLRLATPDDVRSARTSDLRAYFYPSYAAFFGWLGRGVLLRWNPYQACGLPWLGTMQTGFFYPPHVLYLLLPTAYAMFASALLHTLLAALSTAAFARRLGFGPSASAVAALGFSLHGTFPGWLAWPYMFETIAWLPLGALAVHAIATDARRTWIALLATALGMSWLAGGPQASVLLVYAWSTLLVVSLASRTWPGRAWVRPLAGFALALGLGTLAAMIQLLPGREVASAGVRTAGTLDLASMFPAGLAASSLWSVVVVGGVAGFTALGWSLAPLALATRDVRGLVWWAIGLVVVTSCFVLGPVFPLTFALYRALPMLAWFRAPGRTLVLAGFAFALVAGVGTDVLLRRVRDAGSRPGVRGLIGAWVLVPAALMAVRGYVAPGVLVVCAGLAMGAATRWAGGAIATRALCIALVALAAFGIPSFPGAMPYDAASGAVYSAHDAVYRRVATLQADGRVWLAADHFVAGMVPRLATLYGVRSVSDYEPLMLQRQSDYLHAAFASPSAETSRGTPAPLGWLRDVKELATRTHLLDLAAVRYVVVPSGDARGLTSALQAVGMRPVDGAGDARLTVLENPRALPRAFVTYRTLAAPPAAELLGRLTSPAFDPLRTTFVEDAQPIGAADAPSGRAATIVVDEPERVEVDAELAAPGLLVLGDTFAPGWVATVDGESAAIVPANYLFRGVHVPEGRHRVRFEYPSRTLLVGAACSVAGWMLIGFLGVSRDRSET